MLNKYLTIKTAIITLTVSIALLGCSDFLDRKQLDQPSPDNFFVNETSAQNANSAIYNFWVRNADMHGRDMWIILDAMTDDSFWRPNRDVSIQQEKWDIFPTHGPINSYWREVYRSINAANFAIEGIPTATDIAFDDAKRNQYIAEARFMRGFNYLFLTTLYGEVPLILKPLSNFEEYDQPRATQEQIYAAIIDDFTFAKETLPASWPAAYRGRPTRAAGATYLAQTYLFKEDYTNAETAAREAITIAEADGFALAANYQSIFEEATEDNTETIFKFQFVKNSEAAGTNTTVQINTNPSQAEFKNILGDGWMYSLPQRSLYDEYEPDDKRRGYTIYAPGDFYGIYQSPEKTIELRDLNSSGVVVKTNKLFKPGDSVFFQYNWSQTGMGVKKMATDMKGLTNVRWAGKDIPLMRIAELYLILAEALAEQNDPEALTWINKVRARTSVNLPPRAVGDGRTGDTDLVTILRHERRVELAMECKRLFDVMRWKIVGDIFQGTNVKRHYYWMYLNATSDPKASPGVLYDQPAISLPKHYHFPIPQNEIDINPLIDTNNEGY